MSSSSRGWQGPYVGIGLAWGCSFYFIKLSLGFLTPFGVAFTRCAFGLLTLLIVAALRRVALPKARVVWLHLWIVALCINVIPGILFAVAESRATSILAGIINALTPLTALFFISIVFRDEPISRVQLVGLGVGLLGVLVVLGVWRGLGTNPWWAVGALLCSVTLYGVSFPYTRRYLTPRGLNPISLASGQLLLSTLTLLPTFLIDGLNGYAITVRDAGGAICLGVFGSGLAFMWNYRVIEAAGSSIASTVTYLTPVVAIVVGIALLHEQLTWFEPVGGLLVLLGAAIGQGRFARLVQTFRS